jgi:hypothetical protein
VRFSGRQGETAARVINGGRAQRQKDYAADDFCKITNYEKLKPDLDLIAAWAPELVIVDEAQQSLKMPLPAPETARQLTDALSALADGLRGKIM